MKQTTLDLNGPILSFTQNPVGVASTGVSIGSTGGGTATFTGIATATFPNAASNSGSIAYQWYDQNGAISNGTYVTGAATTTLTISNLITPTDHNRQIYVVADYVPSAYGQGPITAGTARSTGNAINDPISSNVGILTVFPILSITTQPVQTTSIQNVSANFSVIASITDITQGVLSYKWALDGTDIVDSSTISGSSTPNLTIALSDVGTKLIKCVITHPTATNSPLTSDEVYFNVISPDPVISIEKYDTTLSTATLVSYNFNVFNEVTLLAQDNISATSLISLYASQIDVNIEMDIYGGVGSNYGSYIGGKGGYSRVRFTMNKNVEYTIAGLDAVNNCPFVYRKGSLIAVCGKGGDAASGGNGGAGGGINVVGASGGGRGGGSGGSLVPAGTLPPSGIFGSASNLTPISPDTKATGQAGGRVLPCSKGNYWISRGYSACSDVGTSQIYLANGTLVTNSAFITRGFKSGYDIRQTAGKGVAQTSYIERVGRTCSNTITRSAVVTHFVSGGQTTSLTVSGDSFDVRAFNTGGSGIGSRYYEIYVPSGITNLTSYSITDVSSQSAGGANNGVYLYNTIQASGTLFIAIFSFSGQGPSFCRSFRVTANQSSDYDCSYDQTIYVTGGGNGGSGATGGSGGSSSGGAGGGGSGYTDGSVTVVSTQQGGSTGTAKVVIRKV
jgi:hypothetical protein